MQQQQQTVQIQQATLLPQPQPNSVVYVQTVHPQQQQQVYNNYDKQQSLGLGITQVVCGVIGIILNIIILAVAYEWTYGNVGYGFWCGFFFILSGGFGIGAAKSPTMCLIVTHMVLSIVSANFAVTLIALGAVGAVLDSDHYYSRDALVAMQSVLAITGLVEFIVSIWASAICCGATCCNNRSTLQAGAVIVPAPQQSVTTVVPVPPNQVVYQGQYSTQQQYTVQQQYAYNQPAAQATNSAGQTIATAAPGVHTYGAPPPAYQPSYETKE